MGKKCDVCGKEIGILGKFRYSDGYICKECYTKASRHFTETICSKTLPEIKKLCSVKRDEKSFESFKVTGKIGSYMLVDEKQRRICLPCNRLTNQTVSEPEFFNIDDIKESRISYQPSMEMEELEKLVMEGRSEQTIRSLEVDITLLDGSVKKVALVHNPLRVKSFAFRKSFQFAKRIHQEIERLRPEEEPEEEKESDYAAI